MVCCAPFRSKYSQLMCAPRWTLTQFYIYVKLMIWVLTYFQKGVFLLRPTVPEVYRAVEVKVCFFLFGFVFVILELNISNFRSHCNGRCYTEKWLGDTGS